jgi:hypothetical protein
MMIAKGTKKVKSMVQELFELESLIQEFKKLKARQAEILRGLGEPQEVLVSIESDLYRIKQSINAREAYMDPRRHINWN